MNPKERAISLAVHATKFLSRNATPEWVASLPHGLPDALYSAVQDMSLNFEAQSAKLPGDWSQSEQDNAAHYAAGYLQALATLGKVHIIELLEAHLKEYPRAEKSVAMLVSLSDGVASERKKKLQDLLKEIAQAHSVEGFARLVDQTIILLDTKLTYEDIAREFSINYPRIDEWRSGRSFPPQGMRNIAIFFFEERIRKELKTYE